VSGEAPYAPLDALEALVRHRVLFVVIGGFGAQLRGSPSITGDTDVCYARDDQNLEGMARALRGLHATQRGAPKDVPFQLDAKTLKMGDHFTFDTDAGAFDILGHPSGIPGGYEELERAAGRPKDLIEVEVLGALRDEIDEQALAERRARRKRR